jgi:8-oxo-dGTP pyrophosphatase MutT (NUDIX family)
MKRQMLVSLGFVTHEDKILLTQRKGVPHIWELPGGKVEFNEEPSNAVVREVKEETGYEVDIIVRNRRLAMLPLSYSIRVNSYLQIILLCFECKLIGGSRLVAKSEVDDVQWFSRNELPEIRHGSKDFIDCYLSFLSNK